VCLVLQLLGGPGSERGADHPVVASLPHLAGEVEAVGLAAAGRGDERVDEPLTGEQAMHCGALFTGQAGLGGEHELRDRGRKLWARSRAAPHGEVDDPLLQRQQLAGRVAASDRADPSAGTQFDVLTAVRVDAEVDRFRIVEQPRGDPLDLVDRCSVDGSLGEVAQHVETSEG